MSAHATLAPSSASRWVQCAGSVRLCQAYPEQQDSADAMEGTAAHWVFEQMLAGKSVNEGDKASNGVLVTDEMLEGAELFCATVGDASKGHVEKKVTMPVLVHPDNWGTPDYWEFDAVARKIRIIDYKFGHRYVEVFENWQLLDYLAGVLDVICSVGTDQVELTIVQPRCFTREGNVRSWTNPVSKLLPYIEQLRTAAHAAMNPHADCTVGPQCQFCSGRHACVALQRAALNVVEVCYRSTPLDLPPEAAARELRAMTRGAALLEARITGLTEQLLQTLRRGQVVPGYAIEQAEGRQKWTVPVPEIIAMGSLMGIKLDNPGVVTPKQAIKLGLPEAMVTNVSEIPIGEFKLVETDTRKSRKAFSS